MCFESAAVTAALTPTMFFDVAEDIGITQRAVAAHKDQIAGGRPRSPARWNKLERTGVISVTGVSGRAGATDVDATSAPGAR